MALTITINITDDEEKILLNDLLDIDLWFQDLRVGKINNAEKRLARSRRAELVERGRTTIPASNRDLALDALNDPTHKNRAQRDAAAGPPPIPGPPA